MSIFNKRTPAPYNGGTIPPERISAMIREQHDRAREEQRIAALEREQDRQAREQERLRKEQERQAAQLAKHEDTIRKLEFQLEQAREDYRNLTYRIGELQEYAKFLQEQMSGCTAGSAEFFKWQRKLSSVDDKIYRLDTQRKKAMFAGKEAKRKLSA